MRISCGFHAKSKLRYKSLYIRRLRSIVIFFKMNKILDRLSINSYHCSMNKLPIEKQTQVIRLLVEGNSLRSISRILDLSFNTVLKLVPNLPASK